MKEKMKWPGALAVLRDIAVGLLLVLGMLLLLGGGLLLGRAVRQAVEEQYGLLSSNRACLPSPGPGWLCRHLPEDPAKGD